MDIIKRLFFVVNPNITSYLPAGSSRYVVNITDDIIFQCTATGVPPPDIQWYRGDDLLSSSNNRITIGNLSVDEPERALATVTRVLTLSQTSTSDSSRDYSCSTTIMAMQYPKKFELVVQGWYNIYLLHDQNCKCDFEGHLNVYL